MNNFNLGYNKMATLKDLQQRFKDLKLSIKDIRSFKKQFEIKGRWSKDNYTKFFENYRPVSFQELLQKAKELGYNLRNGKTKIQLETFIEERIKKNLRNERDRKKRAEARKKKEKKKEFEKKKKPIENIFTNKIGLNLNVDFKEVNASGEIQRIVPIRGIKFNTTRPNINRDITNFTDRWIESRGGTTYWKLIKDSIDFTIIRPVQLYNSMTVPIKRSSAPLIEFFNKQGKLIVDNKFFQNDNCVPEFLFDFIQTNNNKKGTKKLPNFATSQIEDEIKKLWIEEENSHCSYWSIFQIKARGDNMLYHQQLNEEYTPIKHGVSLCQLEKFCKEYNIGLRCLDTSFNLFHSSSGNEKWVIMAIFDDGHIYPIIDKELRKSIQGWKGKKPLDTIYLSNTKTEKDTPDFESLEYQPISCPLRQGEVRPEILPDLLPNTTYITTNKDLLKNIFINKWKTENKRYKYKSKQGTFKSLTLDNGINLLYNKDFDLINLICIELGIEFNNQSLSDIRDIIYPTFDDKPFTSYLNTRTKNIFEKYMSISPWVKQYDTLKSNNYITYDGNKQYSSICKNKTNYIQFDINDDWMPFIGEEIDNDTLYLIETKQNILFQGTGIYTGKIVDIGLDDGLISYNNIKLYIRGSRTNDTKELRELVIKTYDSLSASLAKNFINRQVGLFGNKFQEVGKLKYTNDINTASTSFYTNIDDNFRTVHKVCENPELFEIDDTKNIFRMNATFITNFQIIQEGILKMYKIYKQIGGRLIKVNTDSITIENPEKGIPLQPQCKEGEVEGTDGFFLSTEMGGFKIEDKKPRLKNDYDPYYTFVGLKGCPLLLQQNTLKNIEIIDEWNFDIKIFMYKSFLLQARAGRGKTYLLNKIINEYETQGKIVKKGAYTHCAKKLIKGETLHKIFGRNIDGSTLLIKDFKNIDVLIFDEISMVPLMFYRDMINIRQKYPNIIIIIAGDYNQLKPIGEDHIDFENSNILSDIVEFKAELLINKRCDNKDLDNIVSDIIETKQEGFTGNLIHKKWTSNEPCFLNICRTNEVRVELNKQLMDFATRATGDASKDLDFIDLTIDKDLHDTYSQDMKIYIGLPLRCRKNFVKLDIYNGDTFEVIDYTDKEISLLGEEGIVHTFKFNKEFLYNFNPNYAMTIHSTQGQTFNKPYTIYEISKQSWRSLNVALTRTTNIDNIYIN
jgi:hypothetical protein